MLKTLVAVLALALLTAPPALAAKVNFSGEVTYRERIALPPDAKLRIELIDLALPDRPRLAVSAPTGAGQVPLAFTLTFEDSLILPQHDYALRAEIRGTNFLFRNTEPFPITPLAQTEPAVIVTSPVIAQAEPTPSEEPAAPQQLPLVNIIWQASMIGETPVPPAVEITLMLEPSMRAGGVGGCNSWFSQARVDATSFAIGDIARTQRSCLADRNMLEQSFFDALKAATSWRIDRDILLLLDRSATPLLQFTR
ncbi:MAG: META domain-containing protein [Hyphomicrobiales bacterium]|nr:MAG: META domain-containing protein [Hyphomicrobiales bacterium]